MARAEGGRHHQRQLLHDEGALGVVLGQFAQPLLQGELEEVQLLAGLVKLGLGLDNKGAAKHDEAHLGHVPRWRNTMCGSSLASPCVGHTHTHLNLRC